MEYSFQVHRDYVEVIVSGDFDLADSKASVDGVLLLCEEHRLSKILVNGLRMVGSVTVGARFGLGEYLASKAAPGVRVAILSPTQIIRDSKALQNTANNRGGQVITTDSIEEALAFIGVAAK